MLKQACIYRKCVYLRKPVPRFRQETNSGGGAAHKPAPTPPKKPMSTPVPPVSSGGTNSNSNSSSNAGHNGNTTSTPAPASAISSPASVPSVPSAHQSELSSCRLNQSPFAALSAMQSVNNGVFDPLRHRMMEHQHRSSLFDSMSHHHHAVLDPTKSAISDMSRYPGAPVASAHCKLDQTSAVNHASEMNLAAAAASSPLNSVAGHHTHQANKTPALPTRDSYFTSMDSWSSMPYALPRPPTWATSALPNHHAAAAAYGFQQHASTFPSSFTPSSCRLGLPDSTVSRYGSPAVAQHSFHHSMGSMAGFTQELSHATANHANHANMRSSMNAPFYPPPPHIQPSSIPSFPGLGQFPTNQTSFGPTAYPMHPHAHMYPSGFYSTFRTATEPQIYFAQVIPSRNPFKDILNCHPLRSLSSFNDKTENSSKGEELDCFEKLEVGSPLENYISKDFQLDIEDLQNAKFKFSLEQERPHSIIPSDLKNKKPCFDDNQLSALGLDKVLCVCSPEFNKTSECCSTSFKAELDVARTSAKFKLDFAKTSCKLKLDVAEGENKGDSKTETGEGSRTTFQYTADIDQDLLDRLNQFSHNPNCDVDYDLDIELSWGRLDHLVSLSKDDDHQRPEVESEQTAAVSIATLTHPLSLSSPSSSTCPETSLSLLSQLSTAAFSPSASLPLCMPSLPAKEKCQISSPEKAKTIKLKRARKLNSFGSILLKNHPRLSALKRFKCLKRKPYLSRKRVPLIGRPLWCCMIKRVDVNASKRNKPVISSDRRPQSSYSPN